MKKYVNTDWLNLRTTPNVSSENRITIIPKGQEVTILSETGKWSKVEVQINSEILIGYCATRFLSNNIEVPTTHSNTIGAVHRKENRNSSTINSREHWSFPIGDANRPTRKTTSVEVKINSIYEILKYLDVETSQRYEPRKYTYCNIYAHDYCYLNDIYLPRVWWTQKAIQSLTKGNTVEVAYGKTIHELNANSLYLWLIEYGPQFGWKRVHDIKTLQEKANQGAICVISARNKQSNRSGHISCVIPELNEHKALVKNNLFYPLMSQAGRNNKYLFNSRWWSSSRFSHFGFFYTE